MNQKAPSEAICPGDPFCWGPEILEMPLCEQITDAIKEYFDRSAIKHDCPGVDCCVCGVNGRRYAKVSSIIYFLLKERGIPTMATVTPAENSSTGTRL